MTREQFKKTLAAVKHGTYITYHTGYLFYDRAPVVDGRTVKNEEVDALAREAWRAHKDDRAVLLQRRVRRGVCDYIAVKI
jgi:hypothetical protein